MDWLANRAGELVVSRRVICMSEREQEEEEEDDSMEGFMHTPIRVAYALLPDTFPSSMDIFRHWGGRGKVLDA